MCEAMVAGDVAELDGILSEDFTLTHMTGHVQSRATWRLTLRNGSNPAIVLSGAILPMAVLLQRG